MTTTNQTPYNVNDEPLTTVESLCPNCMDNGTTRLLLKQIPHFKDIIISSFSCPHCNYSNNDLQSAAECQPFGSLHKLTVTSENDINRQVVKSEFATFRIEDIDFEIPPQTQKGVCSTIEGILSTAAENLNLEQPVRKHTDPLLAEKLDLIIQHLRNFAAAHVLPFTISVNDPSGNSYIENRNAPAVDPNLSVSHYKASTEQLNALGFYAPEPPPEDPQDPKPGADLPEQLRVGSWDLNKSFEANTQSNQSEVKGPHDEAYVFETPCPHCHATGYNRMCQIDIPGFRECIIMAFNCDNCGIKENEVRPSGAYGDKGRKWKLRVVDAEDLNRDVLKADTASICLPSVSFEILTGFQGGLFTTVEGLITRLAKELEGSNPFAMGDAATEASRSKYLETIANIRSLVDDSSKRPFEILLDDPADHSYIGPRHGFITHDGDDPSLEKEEYERSDEQNDDLGLLDMKTENYS